MSSRSLIALLPSKLISACPTSVLDITLFDTQNVSCRNIIVGLLGKGWLDNLLQKNCAVITSRVLGELQFNFHTLGSYIV